MNGFIRLGVGFKPGSSDSVGRKFPNVTIRNISTFAKHSLNHIHIYQISPQKNIYIIAFMATRMPCTSHSNYVSPGTSVLDIRIILIPVNIIVFFNSFCNISNIIQTPCSPCEGKGDMSTLVVTVETTIPVPFHTCQIYITRFKIGYP